MNADIRVFDADEELFRTAADVFVDAARAAIASRGTFTVALSGGSTPRSLFARLAASPYREQVEWKKIQWFWGDERTVGPDDQQSNYHMAREALLSKVDVDSAKVFRLRGEAVPPQLAADDYEQALAKSFDANVGGSPPSLDLVLLGMGDDGHTASLFPNTAALNEQRRWVVANHVPQHDTWRLTMTYPLLNAASAVLFLVGGAGKAGVLREVLQGPYDPLKLPSQAIKPAGRLTWFVDRAAASQLE